MLRRTLIVFFTTILISMITICFFAAKQQNIIEFINNNLDNFWFLATLLDCYWGLFIFYIWFSYKEPSWKIRIPSLVCICTLGNIFVALYALLLIYKSPKDCSFEKMLLRS